MATFIITGASQGLGRALAEEAVKQGHAVALLARNAEALNSLKNELGPSAKVTVHPCDLTNSEQVASAFVEIRQAHDSIHALINNAATWTGGVPVVELTREVLQRSLDLNFFSAFNCIQQVIPTFRTQGFGSIINIGATASTRGGKRMAPFAVAKSALRIFSQSLARELGPENIHVAHLIIDGLINNERTRQLNPSRDTSEFIEMSAIANEAMRVASQERSAWTFEWDIRPFKESW